LTPSPLISSGIASRSTGWLATKCTRGSCFINRFRAVVEDDVGPLVEMLVEVGIVHLPDHDRRGSQMT
jgi:hypothetical protein